VTEFKLIKILFCIDALAAALGVLISDAELRQKLARQACVFAVGGYDWGKCVAENETVYLGAGPGV
jgi:glycosyltransferase involved in cell wall biosynthesis